LENLKETLTFINQLEANDIIASLDQILSSSAEFFGKVSSSLRTTLTALTPGSVGEIMRTANANEVIKQLAP